MLQGLGDRALVLRGKPGVLARQDLARISDVAAHGLRGRKWNFRRRGSLLLLFGGAHARKERETVSFDGGLSTRIFLSDRPRVHLIVDARTNSKGNGRIGF